MIEDDDGEPVYKHEPEMEEAYRSEALKAFRKAAAEGKEQREPSRSARFNNAILIVDACNLRVRELLDWVHAAVGAGYSTFVAVLFVIRFWIPSKKRWFELSSDFTTF